MDSATFSSMQGKKNPICARSRDDPRIQRFRMLDGREQVQQKLYHEKLFEEGRRNAQNPKPKTEEGPLPGFHGAIAHYDALAALAAKKNAAAVDDVEAEAEGESGFGKRYVWSLWSRRDCVLRGCMVPEHFPGVS